MNRNRAYIIAENENLSTFQYDNDLPSLPLPKLEDTMQRYYESIQPFANSAELKDSKKVIEDFQNGIGRELHAELAKRAAKERNWLEKWWEDYAYHLLRIPLQPYTVMAMPVLLESAMVPETPEYALKALARVGYHTLEFWDLIRREKLRPASSAGGKIKYSSVLYKRFYASTRIPGEFMDKVETYFKTMSEGDSPHHSIVMGKGRIFKFECLNDDGSILSAQQLLQIFEIIRARIDYDDLGECVPILSNDDRTNWAKNRKKLQELSPKNASHIHDIDSNIMMISFDEHAPRNYQDSSLESITGDFHSKWADKTSTIVSFKSGMMSCIGEHSAYDGTISISYGFFVILSLAELGEPDWSERPKTLPHLEEINFDLDNNLKMEIKRVMNDCDSRRNEVTVTHHMFKEFGKGFLKSCKLHPDAFIQVVMQLAYYKLHQEFAPTYETALMRNYYNGRTETLRSCTMQVVEFVKLAMNPNTSKKKVYDAFKMAVNHHDHMMNEARNGRAIDRHLFGLWCIAYEKNLEIPEFYSDSLYTKSGGGGNFVLSTSTLGYTINTGFVAPMVIDGYGVFYSIPEDELMIQITAYRSSTKTSATKFVKIFTETLKDMKKLIDDVTTNSIKNKL